MEIMVNTCVPNQSTFIYQLRGRVQTIIGKINVIVMLGQGVTLRIAAEGKTVYKQGKFVSNHDVKGGGSELNVTMTLIFPIIVWTCPLKQGREGRSIS